MELQQSELRYNQPWILQRADDVFSFEEFSLDATVFENNGKIFLVYSASETGIAYCMGMLSADENADLLDPLSWKKERYPVLSTDESRGIYGPEHCCFTKDEQGKDILVYHARTEREIVGDPLYNPNRHAMLMNIKWSEQGIPIFDYE